MSKIPNCVQTTSSPTPTSIINGPTYFRTMLDHKCTNNASLKFQDKQYLCNYQKKHVLQLYLPIIQPMHNPTKRYMFLPSIMLYKQLRHQQAQQRATCISQHTTSPPYNKMFYCYRCQQNLRLHIGKYHAIMAPPMYMLPHMMQMSPIMKETKKEKRKTNINILY